MQLKELTKALCSASGPSGYEEPICATIKNYLEPFADEISVDNLGNLIAVKHCGTIGAKKILLNAHMDEVGLVITGAKDGFLSFSPLGGIDPRVLPTTEVRVLGEKTLFGLIDTLPPHLIAQDNTKEAMDISRLYIDIGMDQEHAIQAAPVGTPVVYAAGCEEIGNGYLCGKSLDDRSCVAIVLKVFELLSARELPVELYCLISTQEEVGHRGAVVGAWSTQPDCALVVDVTHAKTPDAGELSISCGQGAVIEFGPNMNRAVTEQLIRIAKEKELSYQIGVSSGGNSRTDAQAIQISRQGVATALISLPLKYMHTPVEMVHENDMASIQRLLCEYIQNLGEVHSDA